MLRPAGSAGRSNRSNHLQAALSGRDVLGLAKTGSGKTAAFLLPLVVHVRAQAAVRAGEGPIALVLAPTRELSEQIHVEARRCALQLRMHLCNVVKPCRMHLCNVVKP